MNNTYQNKKELILGLIKETDVVLDLGFWGQGVPSDSANWVHALLKSRSKDVYGLDLDFDKEKFSDSSHYKKGSAECFDFEIKFDVIFAGDVIEHLSNLGLFLDSCRNNLKKDGRLIITTPNCFSLFSLTEKLSKDEPTVNKDHTVYFNKKTVGQLLAKNNFYVENFSYIYSLELDYRESLKKFLLNKVYWVLSKFTNKFLETLVVVARKD